MSIYCKIGTVNSQKTSSLLATAKSYELQNRNILCIKPIADTRDVGFIKSRTGLIRECETLKTHTNALIDLILEYADKHKISHLDAIFIDEGQFLSKENIDDIIVLSAECRFNFLIYGLNSSFTGEPFESMSTLMAFSKDVEEISNTLCQYCNSKAKMNLRLENGEPVFSGNKISVDKELFKPQYIPVCPICFTKKMLNEGK